MQAAPQRDSEYWQLVEACRKEVGYFQRVVLGQSLWRGQLKILKSVRENKQTLVHAAHGTSKSHTLAGLALEFMSVPHVFAPDAPTEDLKVRVIVTAGTNRQVHDVLWREVTSAYQKAKMPLGGRMMTEQWDCGPDRSAIALSVGDPVSMQGKHAGLVLILLDEAEKIDPPTWEAHDSLMTGDNSFMGAVYNPVKASGYLANQAKRPDIWNIMQMNGLDAPNVKAGREIIPGAITRGWIRRMVQKHAHDPEVADERKVPWEELELRLRRGDYDHSPFIVARVLGKHPETGGKHLITMKQLEALQDGIRLAVPENKHMGVDVALGGEDNSVATVVDEHRNVIDIRVMPNPDPETQDVAAWICDVAKEYQIDEKNVHVEVDGVGAPICDVLRRAPFSMDVDRVQMGGGPQGDWEESMGEAVFVNRRAELWWVAREVIRGKATSVPAKWTETWADLCAPEYDTNLLGKIVVTPRKKLVEQLGRSPDWGTSFVLSLSRTGSNGMALYFG